MRDEQALEEFDDCAANYDSRSVRVSFVECNKSDFKMFADVLRNLILSRGEVTYYAEAC